MTSQAKYMRLVTNAQGSGQIYTTAAEERGYANPRQAVWTVVRGPDVEAVEDE